MPGTISVADAGGWSGTPEGALADRGTADWADAAEPGATCEPGRRRASGALVAATVGGGVTGWAPPDAARSRSRI
ncbi:hypothetical protein DEI84_08815 [Curtobacterium sp. MCBD17_023]|nr:hypothetical protein DEI84_08815 [Curtobacterium sp. MCBD17_023]